MFNNKVCVFRILLVHIKVQRTKFHYMICFANYSRKRVDEICRQTLSFYMEIFRHLPKDPSQNFRNDASMKLVNVTKLSAACVWPIKSNSPKCNLISVLLFRVMRYAPLPKTRLPETEVGFLRNQTLQQAFPTKFEQKPEI